LNNSTSIYNKLKIDILSQKYPAGFHLKEVLLSRIFKTTRIPLREAIIKLEREGLVKIIPNKGAFVIRLSKKEIEELFEVRESLEIKAGILAIDRANKEQILRIQKDLEKREILFKREKTIDYRVPQKDFHLDILKLSKNKILVSIWKSLNNRLSLVRITSAMHNKRFLKTIEEHKEILHNINVRNYSRTEELIKIHIKEAKINLLLHYKINTK